MERPLECPPAETLALLPDGRANRKVRRALLAHLDACSQCRMVLAFTGQYEASREPGHPAGWINSRWWEFPGVAPRFSLAFGVLLAAGLASFLITASLDGLRGTIGRTSTEAIASPLFKDQVASSYSDRRWRGEANSFLFGSGPTPAQTAFRIGVQEVDFRVALEEGRREDAAAALETLRSLGRQAGAARGGSSLEDALSKGAAKARVVEELESLDRKLYSQLDSLALDLGRWAEASRMAASGRNATYFTGPSFQRILADLEERQLPEPVDSEIQRIRAHASSIPSEAAFYGLEKAFRQLILLH